MKNNWNKAAGNLLKAELKFRGITYEQLHEKLKAIGVEESIGGIKVKLSRGTFQFAFLLQCAIATGIKTLHLDQISIAE